MKIISRSGWGAKSWRGMPYSTPLSSRTHFLVHYHGGPPPQPSGRWVPKNIEAIHLQNGWSGVGYNFVVDQAGAVYEGRGWNLVGAHCPGMNTKGIGVYVAIGGNQQPTDAALRSVRALYDEANRKTGRTLVKSWHGNHYATACPGPNLIAWVKKGMPASGVPAITGGGGSSSGGGSTYYKPTGTKLTVKQIQKIVGVKADGYYGSSTKKAVAAYQRKLGVKPADQLWGPATEKAHRAYVSKGKPSKGGGKLAVDGIEGKATVRALQRFLGVKVDGIRGRNTNKAMQKWLGVTQDGIVGRRTIAALQRKVGSPVDSIWGRNTTKALQRFLNRQS